MKSFILIGLLAGFTAHGATTESSYPVESHFCRCEVQQYTNDHYELIRDDIFNGNKTETSLEKDLSDYECHRQIASHPSCK